MMYQVWKLSQRACRSQRVLILDAKDSKFAIVHYDRISNVKKKVLAILNSSNELMYSKRREHNIF